MNDTKQCRKCKEVFPNTIEYFPPHKQYKDGLTTQCRKCAYEYHHQYALDHHDVVLGRTKQWRFDNKERARENDKNKEASNPTIYKEIRRRSRAKRKDKNNAATRNRRAQLKNAEGRHTAQDIQDIGLSQGWKCWWCSEYCGDKYHVDHRIPVSKGGTNWPSNLVITCPSCNLKKHSKMPYEFCKRLL